MRSFSWDLYRALNIYRRHSITRHPAYTHHVARRSTRGIRFRSCLNWGVGGLVIMGVFLFVALAGDSASCVTPLCCLLPIALAVMFLPLWTVPLSLALAPVIVHERTRGTWDLLRVTLLDLDTLIIAKARSALKGMRPLLNYLLVALLLMGLAVGLVFAAMILLWTEDFDPFGSGSSSDSGLPLLIAGIAIGAVGLILFLADRVQQILCMGIAALAAGTSARKDARGAVLFGIGTALGVWVAEYVVALLIMFLLMTEPEIISISIWTVLFMGPMPGFLVLAASPWRMLIAFGMMFSAREYALRGLWRWVLNAAQRE